ncbi:hypothetical protein [Longirhabdus pacifica]|uniref:hypothetical protein n=1 Tax=Longirhabdus pacifica TaxID=2305227 RepID=UPI001008A460|nr:hypothetical protein [Longirhabdus pacifica]
MLDFQVYDIALLPVIIGLVSILKSLGLPEKYAPLVAIALGVPIGLFYVSPADIGQGVLVGITLGLAASGLYSGTKHVARK